MTLREARLAALLPGTKIVLAEQLQVHPRTVGDHLLRMMLRKEVHIGRWEEVVTPRGNHTLHAVYVLGAGTNARRDYKTKTETSREYRARVGASAELQKIYLARENARRRGKQKEHIPVTTRRTT